MNATGEDAAGDFLVEISTAEGASRLALQGRVGTAEAAPLRDRLRAVAATGACIAFDCSRLERLNGAGLQVLLALRVAIESRGGSVSFAPLPPAIDRCFAQAGVRP
jgi:anti-anti-sigma regulatory factor